MSTKHEMPPAENENGPRSFAVLLQKIADGDAHTQLSEDLQALIKVMTVRARDQVKAVAGSLTFTLKLVCDEMGTLDVGYKIARSEPQPKRPRTIFWADKNGNMTEKNPRQIDPDPRVPRRRRLPGWRAPALPRREREDFVDGGPCAHRGGVRGRLQRGPREDRRGDRPQGSLRQAGDGLMEAGAPVLGGVGAPARTSTSRGDA